MRRHEPQSRGTARSHAPRALLSLLAGIVLLVSLGWLAAPTAWAHVTLESSTPAEGQQLAEVPPSVTLKFSGDLDFDAGAEVTVMGPDGASLQVSTTIVSVDTLIQRLNDQRDAPGLYTIEYAATSVDGHPVTGRLGFYVGVAGADGPAAGAGAGEGSETQAPGLVERSEDPSDDGSGVPTLVWVALAAIALLVVGGVLWVRTHRPTPAPVVPAPPVPPRARPVGRAAAARPQPRPRKRR